MTKLFKVVTDIRKIKQLDKDLSSRLSQTFTCPEQRNISYPAGNFSGIVSFEKSHGTNIRAWSHTPIDNKLRNLFLAGTPGDTASLDIVVQINFPANRYVRSMAGAFVIDNAGKIYVAHRGKLSKGRAALPKDLVLKKFGPSVVDAEDGEIKTKLILISALEDNNLTDKLWRFAKKARDVATKVRSELLSGSNESPTPKGRNTLTREDQLQPLGMLRTYFEEFAGNSTYAGQNGGVRTVNHGNVVRELKEAVSQRGDCYKSRAIDLSVFGGDRIYLFEVKTSSRTTDVYTGVGQLVIHGSGLAELYKLPVEKVLVLPYEKKSMYEQSVRSNGLKLVTYKKTRKGYAFEGL